MKKVCIYVASLKLDSEMRKWKIQILEIEVLFRTLLSNYTILTTDSFNAP